MNLSRNFRRRMIPVMLAMGFAGVAAAAVAIPGASPVPSPGTGLDPLTSSELKRTGIILSPPSISSPTISQTQAEVAAIAASHDPTQTTVRISILANVVGPNPTLNCTCWVISFDGPGAPISVSNLPTGESHLVYYVAFVNAQSSKFEFSQEGSNLPSAPS